MIKRDVLATLYLLVLFILAGCGNLNTAVNDMPRLRIMLKMGEIFESEGNPYIEALEKRLNIILEIETPSPSSYNDRLNVVMASGGMPDIVQLNWLGEGNLPLWAKNSLIREIDIEKMPNVQINVSSSLLAMVKVLSDGKVYGIPGITSYDPYGVIIRQDWLDNLGLEQPRTLDEFKTVLKAFTENDPDGNKRNDTVGITSWRLNHVGGVFGGAFKIDYLWDSLHYDMSDTGDEVKTREDQKGYLPFMDFVRELYHNGQLDKEFTSLSRAEDKFVYGKVGMIGGYSGKTIELEKELRKFVPDARLEWILCPCDPEGRVWNFMPESYGYNGTGSQIANNAVFLVTSNADYDTALDFLDKLNSKEMILFSNLGIKGIHYTEFDENRMLLKRTEEQNEAAKRHLFGISDTYRDEIHAYLGNNPEETERLNYYHKKGKLLITNPICFNMGLVPEYARFHQQNPLFKEKERSMALKYVTGLIDRESYINYLTEENFQKRAQLSEILNTRYNELIEFRR
jgi:ABC-type glycerol-3-phosphate transport system substrate-binding protein